MGIPAGLQYKSQYNLLDPPEGRGDQNQFHLVADGVPNPHTREREQDQMGHEPSRNESDSLFDDDARQRLKKICRQNNESRATLDGLAT